MATSMFALLRSRADQLLPREPVRSRCSRPSDARFHGDDRPLPDTDSRPAGPEQDDSWTAGRSVFRRPEVLASVAARRDLRLEAKESTELAAWVRERAFDAKSDDHLSGPAGSSDATKRSGQASPADADGDDERRLGRIIRSPAWRTAAVALVLAVSVAATLLLSLGYVIVTLGSLIVALALRGERAAGEVLAGEGTRSDTVDGGREFGDERRAANLVLERYDVEALRYFWRLLSDQPNFLSHADERATVLPHGLQLETRLNYRMTDGSSPTVLMPLLQISKGALVTQLDIRDRSGGSLPVLSAYETRGLVALCVDLLVGFAFTRKDGTSPPPSPPQDALDALIRFVCRPRAPGQRLEQHGRHNCGEHPACARWGPGRCPRPCPDACADELCLLIKALDLVPDWVRVVDAFCDSLAQSEFVVVEVPRPTGATVRPRELPAPAEGQRAEPAEPGQDSSGGMQVEIVYRQLLAYESRPGRKLSRSRLGLVQDTITSPPLVYAVRAQSYHFQLSPIPDKYVFDHRIYLAASQVPITEHQRGPIELRFLPEGTRSHTHCYVAALRPPKEAEMEDFLCVVHYREVPPGALGGAAMVSLAPAIILTFAAVFSGNLDRFTDLSVALLSLPAVIVLLVAPWSDAAKVSTSSVSTYLSRLTTMAVAVLTLLAWLLDKAGLLDWAGFNTRSGLWLPYDKPANLVWVSLAVVAVAHSAYLWLRHKQAVRSYRRRQDALLEGELNPALNPRKGLVAAQSTARSVTSPLHLPARRRWRWPWR